MDLVFLKKRQAGKTFLAIGSPGYEPQGQNKNNPESCPPPWFLQRLHPAAHLCITNISLCFCFVPRVIITIPQFTPLFNKDTLLTPCAAPPREALGFSGTDLLRRTPSPSPRPLAPFRPCPCIIITPTTITVEQDSCQRQLFCHSFHPSAFLTTIHSFDDCAFSPHLLRRNVSKLCLYPSHFLHILLVPLNDHCPNLPTL